MHEHGTHVLFRFSAALGGGGGANCHTHTRTHAHTRVVCCNFEHSHRLFEKPRQRVLGEDCFLSHLAYVSIRQHTSAYVSIRQHTLAYVSERGFLVKIVVVLTSSQPTYVSVCYAIRMRMLGEDRCRSHLLPTHHLNTDFFADKIWVRRPSLPLGQDIFEGELQHL
jgi:hypothetical protein